MTGSGRDDWYPIRINRKGKGTEECIIKETGDSKECIIDVGRSPVRINFLASLSIDQTVNRS